MYYTLNTPPTNAEDLYKLVPEEEIYHFYYGTFRINELLPCPFRQETRNSFMIVVHNGSLKWIRYGLMDRLSSPIDLVRIKYKLSYYEAIERIYQEIYIGDKLKGIKIENKVEKKKSLQACRYREEYKDFELKYWEQFGITKEILIKFRVYPCTRYWINNILWAYSKEEDPLFVFLHSEDCWTAYRPKASVEDKFRKYNISGNVMGLDLISEYGDILFITSSYKDIMSLYSLGYPAIAPHGERAIISKDLIDTLKLSYKKIYVFYDNDNTGVEQSKELTSIHDLLYINTPKNEPKDPSDYIKKYNKEKLRTFIYSKL